jgi:putative transposase
MVETFFKTLKIEFVWRSIFQTSADAEQAIARYIDHIYNPIQRHSSLNYLSPAQFDKLAAI